MSYVFDEAKQEAAQLVLDALSSQGLRLKDARLVPTKDAQHGSLASSACFGAAKQLKTTPPLLAEKLASKISLSQSRYFASVTAMNGYLNFTYSQQFYYETLSQIASSSEKPTPTKSPSSYAPYGSNASGKGKTIVLEYSQPNVGKPMHVGHIRSTIIGDCFRRLYAFNGWKAVSMNYLGDSGMQVAKLLLAIELFQDMPEPKNEKIMLEYYVKIHQKIAEDPELEKKARQLLEKIEVGDPATLKNVRYIREKSYQAFQRNYDLLGVSFDEVIGESAFIEDSKKVVQEAVKRGIASKEKTGETLAKLEPQLPNTVLLRSNGTTLYLTRDVSLAEYKHQKYRFEKSVVFTAAEQNLHFRQLLRLLELFGKPYASTYHHVGFGTIDLPSGKMSTRKGNVVFLEDVLNEAIGFALKEVQSRQQAYAPETQQEIARSVGIAALKYSVLRIQMEKNIVFVPEEAVKFDGNTASYLQYMAVRAKNVFRKGKISQLPSLPTSYAFNSKEQELVSLLSFYPSVVSSSANSFSPQALCDYAFKLATCFSSFYDACPVLKAETDEAKAARLHLVKSTQGVLESALGLLGIQVPERM